MVNNSFTVKEISLSSFNAGITIVRFFNIGSFFSYLSEFNGAG
jgi:hypothetical protein